VRVVIRELAMSVSDNATRGSRRMSFAFAIASEVHRRSPVLRCLAGQGYLGTEPRLRPVVLRPGAIRPGAR